MPSYLEANIQEELLDIEYVDDDNSIKNVGEVFESMLHDIINIISSPRQNEFL